MIMSSVNTFMSHGAVNEDTEGSECERGAWAVVARSERDGSGSHIGARARPLAATSLPLCGERTYDCACATGWRTVDSGDVQDSRDILAQLRTHSANSGGGALFG